MENREKFEALNKLLSQESTTIEKFQSVAKLAHGINPQIDQTLDKAAEALEKIENLSKGEVIELSADTLPEETEQQKKRKKALILFIKHYKELKDEIERVKAELKDSKSANQQLSAVGRVAAFAKGPVGIITVAAVIIVAVSGLFLSQKPQSKISNQDQLSSSPPPSTAKVKGIVFNGQKIPLDQLAVRNGPDCDSPHYHALDHVSVKAIDGTTIQDPGGCAFGKTKDTQVVEF